jgi:hypothetical protein
MKSPNSSPDRGGRPESPQSNETFPHRRERPGESGLANEVRPGLGTRGDKNLNPAKSAAGKTAMDHDPLGRNAPIPKREPRDQKPDTPAHQAERDTGVTGHTSAD